MIEDLLDPVNSVDLVKRHLNILRLQKMQMKLEKVVCVAEGKPLRPFSDCPLLRCYAMLYGHTHYTHN